METEKIIKLLQEKVPSHPFTERDPYKVLIFTIISQRTRDETTFRVSEKFFSKYDNIRKVADEPLVNLVETLKSSGFYNQKAKNIKKTSNMILDKYDGSVPNNIDNLLTLPGVGRKTANLVLSLGYDIDAIAVDTHVHRISNRIGWVKTNKPEQTENELCNIIPKKYWRNLNSLLVVFGRTICLPRNPKCKTCPIKIYCKKFSEKAL